MKMRNDLREAREKATGVVDMDEALSEKWRFRKELVAHEYGTRDVFISFVTDNEHRIRATFTTDELAELRRGIEAVLGSKLTIGDREYITGVFGSLTPSKPPFRHRYTPPAERPMTPEQRIDHMNGCTFEYFCEWISGAKEFVKGLNEEQYDRLVRCIEDVCMWDRGLPRQRHVKEGDESELKRVAQSYRSSNVA